jgi:hypothetical protein
VIAYDQIASMAILNRGKRSLTTRTSVGQNVVSAELVEFGY